MRKQCKQAIWGAAVLIAMATTVLLIIMLRFTLYAPSILNAVIQGMRG